MSERPWPFKPIRIEVTPDMVKDYFLHNAGPMEKLVDESLLYYPSLLDEIIDKYRPDFDEFVLANYGGE